MFAFVLILVALLSHILPHPWFSFTAVGGSLLYFGARRPLWQAVLPVALLAVGDYYLTVYAYRYPFHANAYLLTWAWYALIVTLGFFVLKQSHSAVRVIGAALISSTSFFVVSNYAVWAGTGSFYPHTASGLATCMAAGLPFYRNDVISTVLVAGLAFGLPELAKQFAAKQETASRA